MKTGRTAAAAIWGLLVGIPAACQTGEGGPPPPALTAEQIAALPKEKLLDDPVLSKAAVTPATPNPLPYEPDVVGRGRQLYMISCAACHSETGKPGPAIAMKPTAPHFDDPAFSRARRDGELFLTIQQGRPLRGMPSWKHFSARDTWAIIQFLRSLSGTGEEIARQGAETRSPATPPEAPAVTGTAPSVPPQNP